MKNKAKKIVILLSALALPIFVFIFLKSFGRNEFEVAPLFQTGSLEIPVDCGQMFITPYLMDEEKLKELQWSSNDSLTLCFFNTQSDQEKGVVSRLSEYEGNISFIKLTNDSIQAGAGFSLFRKDEEDIERLKTCFFLMAPNANAVLVDGLRRIRGHYNIAEREEVDRLLVETKIILKAY